MISNSKIKNKKNTISSFAAIFILIFVAILISWIVYWSTGSNPEGIYHPAGILDIFVAPIKGFVNSANLIIFIMIIGSFIFIINKTRTIEYSLYYLYKKTNHKSIIYILLIYIIFFFLGSILGMWAIAAMPLYFILIPLVIKCGYDKIISMMVICVASETGAMASTINPIFINTAFDEANKAINQIYDNASIISSSTGLVWRIIGFLVILLIGLIFILFIMRRKRNLNNVEYQQGIDNNFNFDLNKQIKLTTQQKITLFVFIFTFILLIIFLIPWDSYFNTNLFEIIAQQLAIWFPYIFGQGIINGNVIDNVSIISSWTIFEISIVFLISSVIIYLINRKSIKLFDDIIFGAKKMLAPIFIISCASGLSFILMETGIQQGITSSLISLINVNEYLFVFLMFFSFVILSIFIPSMSAFAKVVYPTISPILTKGPLMPNGSRLTISGSIMSGSLANGLIHIALPISAPIIYGLTACNISLKMYYKTIRPLLLSLFIASFLLIIAGMNTNLF